MQLVVKLTTACNLNCVYCSEGDKVVESLSKEQIFKVIDEFPALLDAVDDKYADILWHGGEPLLMGPDFLDEVMSYAEDKLKDYELRFMLQSNGMLVNEEWIAVFQKHKVSVGVSLDGYEELHDANRKTKDGQATFAQIMENIKALKEAKVYGGSLMVLNTEKEIDLDRLFDFIQESQIAIKIHAVIPCGRASERNETESISDKYVDLLIALYKKSMEFDRPMDISPISELVNSILLGKKVRECAHNGTCGSKFICIYANGHVGFCGRAESEQFGLHFGSIENKTLLELYHSESAERIRNRVDYLKEGDCKDCSDWEQCMGGCSFEATNYYGVLEHKYPGCAQRKKLLSFLRTEGIDLLQERLLSQKRRYRALIKEKKRLLGALQYAGE